MSFFKSRTGAPINGSEENSFTTNFRSLPDNTQAVAVIKSFTLKEYMGDKNYQVIWKLVDGDFKGAEVKQSIRPFEDDDNKAQRALNMMYRLLRLADHPIDFRDAPTDSDLATMKGKIFSIKTGFGIIQGEERTWVREVWRQGDIETCTGDTKPASVIPTSQNNAVHNEQSALERHNKLISNTDDSDIPFK